MFAPKHKIVLPTHRIVISQTYTYHNKHATQSSGQMVKGKVVATSLGPNF